MLNPGSPFTGMRNQSVWSLILGPFPKSDGFPFAILILRIGFWGPLYRNHNKEPPKII